jgi:1-acyl-sn-glycerol-3-phosphate acyltransferase
MAPVHRSYIDTLIAAGLTKRRLRFMGKDTMWKYPRLGWLFSALGAFPVRRGTADREALMRCIEVLEGGEPLVLFPEGERKDGPVVQPLFHGAAFLAVRAGVPIVPIGIGGSAAVMPRHAKFLYPKKLHVVIGTPIRTEASGTGRSSRRAIAELTETLYAELQCLFDEASRRVA